MVKVEIVYEEVPISLLKLFLLYFVLLKKSYSYDRERSVACGQKYSSKLDFNPSLDPVGDLRSLQGPAFYAINRNAYCNPSYATPLYTKLPTLILQPTTSSLLSSIAAHGCFSKVFYTFAQYVSSR